MDEVHCAVCGDVLDPESSKVVNVGCRWFFCGDCVVEIAAQVNQVLSERSAGGSFIGVQNDAANQHRRLH